MQNDPRERRAEQDQRKPTAEQPARSQPTRFSSRASPQSQNVIQDLRAQRSELKAQNTELRRAEADARAGQTRYVELYDFAPVGFFTLNRHGEIAQANFTGAEMLGVAKDLLRNRKFAAHMPGEERTAFDDFFRKTLAETSKQACELKLLRGDGSAFPAEIQGIGVGTDGPAHRQVYLAVMDITAHKQLEEELRQAQKLEAIGILAGGVAHEFNNLLTGILVHAELLKARSPGETENGGSAQEIIQATLTAAGLTRQLLTFSRRQVPHTADIQLNQVISSLLNMLRQILGEDIALESRLESDLPPIRADPNMLEQVLINLAANARDAMPNGGRLTVSTRTVTIDESYVQGKPEAVVGRFVRLTVEDTGGGIAPPHLVHIFEPFFTTKDVGKGTGLGLASVYGIVKQHHGWIEVASTVGKGTAFHVFLPPAKQPAAFVVREQPAQLSPEGVETVLVLEDAPDLRKMVRAVLERLGYEVLEAASGKDALEAWHRHQGKIDLLFADLVMPGGMNGREVAARLLSDNPNLKVIYTSGYSTAVLGQKFALEEGRNFIQKPFGPRKLAQVVRRRLDEKTAGF